MLTDGIMKGECTEDYFKDRFVELASEYTGLARYFEHQTNEIAQLFNAADKYARDNDLRCGLLYDCK